jgi:hypothetical protein
MGRIPAIRAKSRHGMRLCEEHRSLVRMQYLKKPSTLLTPPKDVHIVVPPTVRQ